MMAVVIFVGEVIVMFVLAAIPPLSVATEAFVDGVMITALMVPFLYLLLSRPMAAEINRRRGAEEALGVLNLDLEKQVKERIDQLSQTNERLEREISEKRQARDEISKDHEFIRSVVEAAPCLFVIYDVGARRCVFANSHVEDLLGYSTEEVFEPGRDFLKEVLSPEDYSNLTEVLLEPTNQRSSTMDLGEIRMRKRSGDWTLVGARYVVLRRDPQGQSVEILLAAIASGE